jgi:hypothetical protein
MNHMSSADLRSDVAIVKPANKKAKRNEEDSGRRSLKRFQEVGNDSNSLWIRIRGEMKMKTCTTKRSGMKTSRMGRNQPMNGIHMHSSKRRAASLHALLNTARIRTSRTLTRRRDATSYTLRKGRDRHPNAGILFFSRKALKERKKAKEKARESRAKAKAVEKAKNSKGKNLKVLGEASTTLVTSASSQGATKRNAPNIQLLLFAKTGYGRI